MHILGWCPHPQTCVSYQDQWHDNFRSQQNINVLRCRSSLYSQPWLLFTTHVQVSPSLAIWYPSYTLPSDVFQNLRKTSSWILSSHTNYAQLAWSQREKPPKDGRKSLASIPGDPTTSLLSNLGGQVFRIQSGGGFFFQKRWGCNTKPFI